MRINTNQKNSKNLQFCPDQRAEVLKAYEKVGEEFIASKKDCTEASISDTIVLSGCAAVENAEAG